MVLSEEYVLQPDILFISKERSHIIAEPNIQGAPDLVVEILSPATAERDRGLKAKIYAKYGVREYWLIDPNKNTIEVMALGETGFETIKIYEPGESLESPILQFFSLTPGKSMKAG